MPRINVNYSSVWKKFLYEGEILLPGGSENIVENRIWPLHWTMALNNETEEIELKQNMTDLQDMATKYETFFYVSLILINVFQDYCYE